MRAECSLVCVWAFIPAQATKCLHTPQMSLCVPCALLFTDSIDHTPHSLLPLSFCGLKIKQKLGGIFQLSVHSLVVGDPGKH